MIVRMMYKYEAPSARMGRILKLRHDIDLYERELAHCLRKIKTKIQSSPSSSVNMEEKSKIN
jgi:hypothetical protein